jgi:hypothetical protein
MLPQMIVIDDFEAILQCHSNARNGQTRQVQDLVPV